VLDYAQRWPVGPGEGGVVDRALRITHLSGPAPLDATGSEEPLQATPAAQLIQYLKDGDPGGAEYIRLKDLYNYLLIALPASNLPAPRFLTQQDIGDLVLCRNPARQTINAASSAPQYDATSHSPAPASAVSTGNSYITQGKRVGRIVEYDEGYSEFNPLPSALMDVDSRVPRTPEQLAELLDDRPPNWESRLFAGVALQELGHLRAKFARQFRGPIEWNGDECSGQAAYSFITGGLDDIGEASETSTRS
jgi:hypothetical protein